MVIKKDYKGFIKTWIKAFLPLKKPFIPITGFFKYLKDMISYSKLEGAESLRILNSFPVFSDDTKSTPFDPHYLYQAMWGSSRICKNSGFHLDIGSDIDYVGLLSTRIPVIFIDIRPVNLSFKSSFYCTSADILHLPFENSSINSLSCMHVAEHIGLGRYGDCLNPEGTKQACKELARILEPGGNLFFTLPVGIPKVCFNAHRIHSPETIVEYFRGLTLMEFSGVHDDGRYVEQVGLYEFSKSEYACGFFWFRKQ